MKMGLLKNLDKLAEQKKEFEDKLAGKMAGKNKKDAEDLKEIGAKVKKRIIEIYD
jgi:hypothetical protein